MSTATDLAAASFRTNSRGNVMGEFCTVGGWTASISRVTGLDAGHRPGSKVALETIRAQTFGLAMETGAPHLLLAAVFRACARCETCKTPTMKTITIRDLRQRWPEAEKALQTENELIVTRDGRPVANLIRFMEQKRRRKRWDPEEHMKWLKKVWGNKMFPSSDAQLAEARADRKLI